MDPIDEKTLRLFIENSMAVMTTNPQAREAWLSDLGEARRKALDAGAESHAEFFAALTALIEGKKSRLSPGNPYASAIKSVVEGVKAASNDAGTLSGVDLRAIIVNTVAVQTTASSQRDLWRGQLEQELQVARSQGASWQAEAELYSALLALLDGAMPSLPSEHAYAGVLKQIALGIAQAAPASGLSQDQIENTIDTTLAALLDADELAIWRDQLQEWFDTAQAHKLSDDADWFALLMGVLNGETRELAQGHRYGEAARLLQARLLAQMSDGGEVSMDRVLQVVRAFVAAPDWDHTEEIFGANQSVLLSPAADDAFEVLLGQAKERNDEATLELLRLHHSILGVIKQEGPKATFAWIRAQDDLDD